MGRTDDAEMKLLHLIREIHVKSSFILLHKLIPKMTAVARPLILPGGLELDTQLTKLKMALQTDGKGRDGKANDKTSAFGYS